MYRWGPAGRARSCQSFRSSGTPFVPGQKNPPGVPFEYLKEQPRHSRTMRYWRDIVEDINFLASLRRAVAAVAPHFWLKAKTLDVAGTGMSASALTAPRASLRGCCLHHREPSSLQHTHTAATTTTTHPRTKLPERINEAAHALISYLLRYGSAPVALQMFSAIASAGRPPNKGTECVLKSHPRYRVLPLSLPVRLTGSWESSHNFAHFAD